MKRSILFLFACLAFVSATMARQPEAGDNDVDQWVNDMREFKHDFLARELDLSREQQAEFFKVYDAMQKELGTINRETRSMCKRLKDVPQEEITDLEYDMAIDALYNLKAKEAEIELRYLPELKEVLSKQQLFELKNAERKFTMRMMRRHHDIKAKRHNPDKE